MVVMSVWRMTGGLPWRQAGRLVWAWTSASRSPLLRLDVAGPLLGLRRASAGPACNHLAGTPAIALRLRRPTLGRKTMSRRRRRLELCTARATDEMLPR